MKFCKVLEGQDKDIPEFNHIVLRYKQLKKKIKAIPKAPASAAPSTHAPGDAAAPPTAQPSDVPAEAPSATFPQPPSAPPSEAPSSPAPAPDPATDHAAGPSEGQLAGTAAPSAASVAGTGTSGVGGAGFGSLSREEQDFMATLNEDVNRFNTFFMEKEEDAVIKLQSIEEQLDSASDADSLNELKGRLVNFHGELVMILHWSLINYSAIVKILKKHDKRSGVLLRAPYLANVLTQPFSSTNVMSRLVKRAEELVAAAAAQQVPGRKRRHASEEAVSIPLTAKAAAEATAEATAGSRLPGAVARPGAGLRGDGEGAGASGRADRAQGQDEAAGRLSEAGAGPLGPWPRAGAWAPEGAQRLLTQRGGSDLGASWSAGFGATGGPSTTSDDEGSSLTEVSPAEEPAIRRTKLALEMWQTLAKSASTPSTILCHEGSAAPTPAPTQVCTATVGAAALLDEAACIGAHAALAASWSDDGEAEGDAEAVHGPAAPAMKAGAGAGAKRGAEAAFGQSASVCGRSQQRGRVSE